MAHVFISYSRKDMWVMRLVASYLRQKNFKVWVDKQIESGTPFPPEIQKNIDLSGCVIVILSPESVSSKWVRDEWVYAQKEN